MHTSTLLISQDFEYWQSGENGLTRVDFETFCPDYHELDRTGVISPHLENGILHAGYALLALTTAFYDIWRVRTDDFFIYPQHFAILDITRAGVNTGCGRLPLEKSTLGGPWGNLDVWPDSKWIPAHGSVSSMLKKAFDLQINRLFWPEAFRPNREEKSLPAYAVKMLRTHLKAVYYYNTSEPNIEIRTAQNVQDLLQTSLNRLSDIDGLSIQHFLQRHVLENPQTDHRYVEQYRKVDLDHFLNDMADCFENA